MTTLPHRHHRAALAVALCGSVVLGACATERKAGERSQDVERAAPEVPRGDGPDESLSRQLLERAAEREARRATRAWRCLVEHDCAALSEDERRRERQDRELALEVLRQRDVERAADRLPFRTAARIALEESVREYELARAALEDSTVLHDGPELPYAYADLPSALAQAQPSARTRLLSSSSSLVDARLALSPSAPEARAAITARARRSAPELIALRAGLTEAELRALSDDVLARTADGLPALPSGPADVPALLAQQAAELDATSWRRGPLVATFGGRRVTVSSALPQCVVVDPPRDVRLIEGAHTTTALARYARACASAALRLPEGAWDPIWLHVVASLLRDTAWLSRSGASRPEARERQRAAYLLEVRRLAVEVRALLEGKHDVRAVLDAHAMSWTSPGAAVLPGASSLLALDASGAAADALVAATVAAAIDNAFTSRFGPAWPAEAASAPAVEEELDRLGLVWHDEGPRGLLRALGITRIDAAPVVVRAARLAP